MMKVWFGRIGRDWLNNGNDTNLPAFLHRGILLMRILGHRLWWLLT